MHASSVLRAAEALQSKAYERRSRVKGRDARATVDQVLDPRTVGIIRKMITSPSGPLSAISHNISAGKEANVYLGLKKIPESEGKSLAELEKIATAKDFVAIKVYRTAILGFRDRDRYVVGERRFEGEYCRSNPRKMVKLWAEKEMRNLKRLQAAGIPCPNTIGLKKHVLVMDFISENHDFEVDQIAARELFENDVDDDLSEGFDSENEDSESDSDPEDVEDLTFLNHSEGIKAAPRLKDAVEAIIQDSGPEQVQSMYEQVCINMWKMTHKCNLVHGDLSEYNLLYSAGKVFFIDVSQSVEFDHPNALVFLREDCKHVTDFFRKYGARVLSIKGLFSFLIDDQVVESDLENRLHCMIASEADCKVDQTLLDDIFMKSFIPRSLDEVYDLEMEKCKLDELGEMGIVLDLIKRFLINHGVEEHNENSVERVETKDELDSDDDDDDDDTESGSDSQSTQTCSLKGMSKEEKKQHKKLVKEQNREKRLTKMKKKDKKKKMKAASNRRR